MQADLLTSAESSDFIGIKRREFARAVESGLIKPVYIPPTKTGARLYDLEDVLALKNTLEQEGNE